MRQNLEPTNSKERLLELDVLRGFALFGILVVNMSYFSTPTIFLEILGIQWWDDKLNNAVKMMIQLLFEFKFIAMFSFLFGVGFILFISRMEQKGFPAKRLFKRRLLFLLFVGLIHLFFIWYGDILTIYALLGFLLLYFIHKERSVILKWASILLFVPSLLISIIVSAMSMNTEFNDKVEEFLWQANYVYQEGSITEIFQQRIIDIIFIYQAQLFIIPMIFAMFLFGMYAWKSGFIQNAQQKSNVIKRIRNYSFMIGAPLAIVSVLANFYLGAEGFHYLLFSIKYFAQLISGPALAIFYMTSIFLLLQNERWRNRLAFLQPVGRMAFTNYLLQSLICTTLFYSYGFSLFGKVNTTYSFLLAIIIFVLQIIFSYYWLKRYKIGPMELVWRKFTYSRKMT